MSKILREYRFDVSKRAIQLGDRESEEINPFALAIRDHFPPEAVQSVLVNGNLVVIEFQNNVLMCGMGADAKDFYTRMVSGQPLEPQEFHLWVYRLAPQPQPTAASEAAS